MRSLYLLRHGKSNWGAEFSGDHERPLAPRGELAAQSVGRFLTALGQVPEAIVSSSAVRALDTARIASEAGGWSTEIDVAPEFYQAAPRVLLDRLRATSDGIERVLYVGHEPTWSETVGLLIGEADVKMVTAALARVDLAVDSWRNTSFGCGILGWLVTPKLLVAAGGGG